MVSDRVAKMGFSATLKISARAKALKAEGVDIIDFSVGEPDFNTPDNIKSAGIEAIESNFTRYTPASGIPDLKKAVCKRLDEDYNLLYRPEEIIISPGAKASLYFAALNLFNPGDECIVPVPYWVSYPEILGLAEAIPVEVVTDEANGFKITADELRSAITYKTKALLLNNPSNPTGTVYTRQELEDIAKVVLESDMYVIADEIYDKVIFDNFEFTSFAALGDEIRKRTIIVNGVSKAYAMTGWRIGYAAGPEDIIKGMGKVQSHATSNPCSIAQIAATEAFAGPQFSVRRMAIEFQQRRNFILNKFNQIKGVTCYKPEGAFYIFPNVSSYFCREADGMRVRDSFSLAYYLLETAKVAVVPGDAFGMPGFIRLSYATSMENIEKGMDRITEAMSRLRAAPKEKVFMLNNTITKVKRRVPSEKDLSLPEREKLLSLCEKHLEYDEYHEWNANINGVIIQLRTNSPHLVDFWMENWYPAELESDIVPHGVIYAVKNVEGHEPYAYYNSESKTAFFINTAYYGMVRGWALGIVGDISERLYDTHAVNGACIEVDGEGVLIIGATGTGRNTLAYGLVDDHGAKVHSDDWFFIRYRGDDAIADISERKFYMRTNIVDTLPRFESVFMRSKCENIVETAQDHDSRRCKLGDDCPLENNGQYCLTGHSNARAIVDPNWITPPGGYIRRTKIKHVVILKRDPVTPSLEEISSEEAVKILETGRYQVTSPGKQGYGSFRNRPFFNPYLMNDSRDGIELQKKYFRNLFSVAKPYVVNTGAESIEKSIARLKRVLTKE